MVVISMFNVVDGLLSMKWNPGSIIRLLKSADNIVKSRIISLTIMFFISIVRMELQIIYIHCADVFISLFGCDLEAFEYVRVKTSFLHFTWVQVSAKNYIDIALVL